MLLIDIRFGVHGTPAEITIENKDIAKIANMLENSKDVIKFKVFLNGQETSQISFGFGGYVKWAVERD
jgi:hypothetical protein